MGALFTSAADGSLAIGENPEEGLRARAALTARIPVADLRWMHQVHGNDVAVVDRETTNIPTCDALVTADPAVGLAVLVADCIPVLFFSMGIIGAAHVGRRGLVNQVAIATVERMRDLGADQITARRGPSICGRCYEVPSEMFHEVSSLWPRSASQTPQGTPALDLGAGLDQQMESIGVTIESDPRCTREDLDLFSYRRDQRTGRFAGVIWQP